MLCRALRFDNGQPILFAKKELLSHTLALKGSKTSTVKSSIGRSWITTVSIDDAYTHVDEHHADIIYDTKLDEYTLVPLKTTFLNGDLITIPKLLDDEDVISFGSVEDGQNNECTFMFRIRAPMKLEPLRPQRQYGTKAHPHLFVGVEESTSATMVDELTCYVCLEVVEKPCVLQCGHMGCEQCLMNILVSNEARCGLCRNGFSIENITPCISLRNIVSTLKHRRCV